MGNLRPFLRLTVSTTNNSLSCSAGTRTCSSVSILIIICSLTGSNFSRGWLCFPEILPFLIRWPSCSNCSISMISNLSRKLILSFSSFLPARRCKKYTKLRACRMIVMLSSSWGRSFLLRRGSTSVRFWNGRWDLKQLPLFSACYGRRWRDSREVASTWRCIWNWTNQKARATSLRTITIPGRSSLCWIRKNCSVFHKNK